VRPVSNPPNPWLSTHVDYLGEAPDAELEVYEEHAKSILSENDSPDIGFRWSVNPYRGCFHACSYCYARPSHQYLGWGAGTDFDRKIVVKVNAAELLREAFMKPKWVGELLMFSGITDCYQPLEASYGVTRACLEVCAEFKNPVAMITKSMVIRRDVELLARLARDAQARVTLSIPFARDDMGRKIEPYASLPSRRFETLKMLSDAGVRTGIAIAPVIPGLNDADVAELLERAREAGATGAFMTMLRLPAEVRPVFQQRIRETLMPERVKRIENAIVELRGGSGKMNDARFGDRFVGQGERWKAIEAMFELHYKRLGFGADEEDVPPTTFQRPAAKKAQLDLF
jgi:DNA repair photolyase